MSVTYIKTGAEWALVFYMPFSTKAMGRTITTWLLSSLMIWNIESCAMDWIEWLRRRMSSSTSILTLSSTLTT